MFGGRYKTTVLDLANAVRKHEHLLPPDLAEEFRRHPHLNNGVTAAIYLLSKLAEIRELNAGAKV